MRKNHHNPNKVPPFKPDPEHWTKKSSFLEGEGRIRDG